MEDKRKQIFNWFELEESENINTQTNKQTLKQQSRWFLRLKRNTNGESTW